MCPPKNSFNLKVFFFAGKRGSLYFWKSLRSRSCLGARSLPGRLEFHGAHGVPRSCCVKQANPTEFHGVPTEFHGFSTKLHGVPRSSTELPGVARKGAAGLQDTPPLRSCVCCGLIKSFVFYYFTYLLLLFIYYFMYLLMHLFIYYFRI